MFDAVLGEPIARDQAGLPGPDDEGVDFVVRFFDVGLHGYFLEAFAFGAV